jgi:hypothetical protein
MNTGLHPDLTHHLTRDLYYQIVHALRGALPLPVTDSPEDCIRRDNSIIAQVASLLPANADEVILATQYIAANAHALDCLRLAHQHEANTPLAMKCTAQSSSMFRAARGARAQLLRAQAAREKRQTDNAARDKDAGIERAAIGLMADAMTLAPPDAMAEPLPPPLPAPEAEDKAGALTEAEKYALAHPKRAALIRSIGGLPRKLNFGPMSRGLVADIVHGKSPILQALGKKPPHRPTVAA